MCTTYLHLHPKICPAQLPNTFFPTNNDILVKVKKCPFTTEYYYMLNEGVVLQISIRFAIFKMDEVQSTKVERCRNVGFGGSDPKFIRWRHQIRIVFLFGLNSAKFLVCFFPLASLLPFHNWIPYKTFLLRTKCDGFPEISPYFRTAKISVIVIKSVALFLTLFQ